VESFAKWTRQEQLDINLAAARLHGFVLQGAGEILAWDAADYENFMYDRPELSEETIEELAAVTRVIAKRLPGAPHETLLVLDGTIGQNAVQQARSFTAAVPITGLVVTKLDGTARGGVVLAVHEAIDVPVKFIGTGEQVDDLSEFDAADFARDVLGEE